MHLRHLPLNAWQGNTVQVKTARRCNRYPLQGYRSGDARREQKCKREVQLPVAASGLLCKGLN